MSSSKSINSTMRATDTLRSISQGAERITDVMARTSLGKSTVHRLLSSLNESDLVSQDPISKRHYLGPLIHQIMSKLLVAHQSLIAASATEMKRLMRKSRETVTLSIPLRTERNCLEEFESPEGLKCKAGKGSMAPLYAGAAGKVLLAAQSQLQSLLKATRFTQLQKNILTDIKTLLEQLKEVKNSIMRRAFPRELQIARPSLQ